jgi:tRNA 2-selenouridine synthase
MLLCAYFLHRLVAPIEFEQGAFPQSQNLILMNDDERKKIGTCYKNKGQEKAIELGHELVPLVCGSQTIDCTSSLIALRW